MNVVASEKQSENRCLRSPDSRHISRVSRKRRSVKQCRAIGFESAYWWLSNTSALVGNHAEAFESLMKSWALKETDEETIQSFKTTFETFGWQGVLRERVKRFDENNGTYFHY